MTADARAAVLARIAGTRVPLRIVLKTRDEPLFLGDWLAHHAALVGAASLVVLDNGSTDPGVLATYEAWRARVPIVPVEGYYNDVHFPARCADLYAALRAGSDAFLFLDTDEVLAWFDGERFRADAAALAPVLDGIRGDFIPTTRLNALPRRRDRFGCGAETLRHQLKWSKPIVRAGSQGWPELINCNIHLRGALRPDARPGYFVLHRAELYPEQRIRNNVNKLVGRGFMRAGEPLEAVLAREVPHGQWIVRTYVDEIRRLRPLVGQAAPGDTPLAPATMALAAGGTPRFASPAEEVEFRTYVGRFADAVREVIVDGRGPPG